MEKKTKPYAVTRKHCTSSMGDGDAPRGAEKRAQTATAHSICHVLRYYLLVLIASSCLSVALQCPDTKSQRRAHSTKGKKTKINKFINSIVLCRMCFRNTHRHTHTRVHDVALQHTMNWGSHTARASCLYVPLHFVWAISPEHFGDQQIKERIYDDYVLK